MVDTDGQALELQAHAADIQDRDGAGPLLRASMPKWPFVRLVYIAAQIKDAQIVNLASRRNSAPS